MAADSRMETAAPPATKLDVFGNAETQRVETSLLALQKQMKQPASLDFDQTAATKAYDKVNVLLNGVKDREQLIRLAYWSQVGIAEAVDQQIDVAEATFLTALGKLRSQFPDTANDAIYEISDLVRADGHVGEEIDDALHAGVKDADNSPMKRPPCVYVDLLRHRPKNENDLSYVAEPFNADIAAAHFNLTRDLRAQWLPHWSGCFKYSAYANFAINPDGFVTQTTFEAPDKAKADLVKQALTSIPKRARLGAKAPLYIRATFAG